MRYQQSFLLPIFFFHHHTMDVHPYYYSLKTHSNYHKTFHSTNLHNRITVLGIKNTMARLEIYDGVLIMIIMVITLRVDKSFKIRLLKNY